MKWLVSVNTREDILVDAKDALAAASAALEIRQTSPVPTSMTMHVETADEDDAP